MTRGGEVVVAMLACCLVGMGCWTVLGYAVWRLCR